MKQMNNSEIWILAWTICCLSKRFALNQGLCFRIEWIICDNLYNKPLITYFEKITYNFFKRSPNSFAGYPVTVNHF